MDIDQNMQNRMISCTMYCWKKATFTRVIPKAVASAHIKGNVDFLSEYQYTHIKTVSIKRVLTWKKIY